MKINRNAKLLATSVNYMTSTINILMLLNLRTRIAYTHMCVFAKNCDCVHIYYFFHFGKRSMNFRRIICDVAQRMSRIDSTLFRVIWTLISVTVWCFIIIQYHTFCSSLSVHSIAQSLIFCKWTVLLFKKS